MTENVASLRFSEFLITVIEFLGFPLYYEMPFRIFLIEILYCEKGS
jgi:hypothetical protein